MNLFTIEPQSRKKKKVLKVYEMYSNNKCLQQLEMCSWAFQKQKQRHAVAKQSLLESVRSVLVRLLLPPLSFQEVKKKTKG